MADKRSKLAVLGPVGVVRGYIQEAKRDETKARRLEKILPMIRAGCGLHDTYRGS